MQEPSPASIKPCTHYKQVLILMLQFKQAVLQGWQKSDPKGITVGAVPVGQIERHFPSDVK